MGKHERLDVFIAENIVNDLLNGVTLSEEQRGHKLFPCAEALAERIKRDFPNIRRGIHVGNVYGTSLGDVKLVCKDGTEIFLELKFLSQGTGTRANIGQNSLTDFGLFNGKNIVSWSAFREMSHHNEWVEEELNKFINYPAGCETIYDKASYLKDLLEYGRGESTESAATRVLLKSTSSGEALAARIVIDIMNRDRREKLEYIEYLNN